MHLSDDEIAIYRSGSRNKIRLETVHQRSTYLSIYLSLMMCDSYRSGRYRREFRELVTRWIGLRASDDVIPMEAIVRAPDLRICVILLSVLLNRHFSIRVLAICRYNTGSFNGKTHWCFLFFASDSGYISIVDYVVSHSERVFSRQQREHNALKRVLRRNMIIVSKVMSKTLSEFYMQMRCSQVF